MAHKADVQAAGMHGNTTIKWMLVGVESPRGSSVVTLNFPGAASHRGRLRRRPQLLSSACRCGEQRPLVPRSRYFPRLKRSVRRRTADLVNQ
jgi:hypothetical protein